MSRSVRMARPGKGEPPQDSTGLRAAAGRRWGRDERSARVRQRRRGGRGRPRGPGVPGRRRRDRDGARRPRRSACGCWSRPARSGTAARTSILAAFTSGQGYAADADYSPRAWLIHKTRITKGAAVGYTAWVRRAAAHPQVAAALAAGEVAESVARTICGWTDKLPQECQEDADAILLGAAAGGADVADLAGLAGEIYARSLPRDKIKDEDGDAEEGGGRAGGG